MLREQKSDESVYRYGYQGQFSERDLETGWNHFELREYDPIIGRWLIPDPARQYFSPYIAFGNDPINRIDPDGGTDRPKYKAGGPCLCSTVDMETGEITTWTGFLGQEIPLIEMLSISPDIVDLAGMVGMVRFDNKNYRYQPGEPGLQFNEQLDFGLTMAGGILGGFEAGAAITAWQTTAKSARMFAGILGHVGTVLTGVITVHEILTGHDGLHTWVNVGVTVVGATTLTIVGAAALPWVAAGGLVYGIASFSGLDNYIDNTELGKKYPEIRNDFKNFTNKTFNLQKRY